MNLVNTGAVALAVAPATGDYDGTNRTITLTLAKKLEGGVGDAVTINPDDDNPFPAVISSDALAPTYTFAWLTGETDAPAAAADINDLTKVTVTMA